MHQGAALDTGEHSLVDRLGILLFAHDQAAARSAQGFMRSRSNDVGIRHRAGMQTRSHKTGDVGDIHHQQRPNAVRDLRHPFKIYDPGISAGAGNDDFRFRFSGSLRQSIIIDSFRLVIHTIRDHIIIAAGNIYR